mmetsp:Transcript_5719/g.8814  ORF Transcript_5719/g.8814 Transcript_5719/m.8814 type:complete len:801 (-) Transcript_5719:46-2448(-)
MTTDAITNDHDALISDFLHSTSHPEDVLLPLLFSGGSSDDSKQQQKQHQDQLRQTCRYLFQEVERLSKINHDLQHQQKKEKGNDDDKTAPPKSLAGIEELYVGGSSEFPVDAETLWGQVDMQNAALQSLLKKSVKKVIKGIEKSDNPETAVRLLDMGEVMSEEEKEENDDSSSDAGESGESADDEDEGGEDEETRRIRERMERSMAEMDDGDDDMDDYEEEEKNGKTKLNKDDEEESLEDPAADELNDGFFDINEMEEFADEEEAYLPEQAWDPPSRVNDESEKKTKKSFHQKQREGDVDSVTDDDDDNANEETDILFGSGKLDKKEESHVKRQKYREDDEIDALYSMYDDVKQEDHDDGFGDDDDDGDSVVNMTAQDLFGKPKKKYFDQWNAKTKDLSPKKNKRDDDDADSWDNHDFNEDEMDDADKTGWRDDTHSDEEEEGGEENEEEEVVEHELEAAKVAPPSAASTKLEKQTEQIEKEMLAEKPWQMVGESKGTSRPVNSLLEATPEFEVATKMAPLITVEHTENIEDMIKRRILKEDWDDVAPRELPDVGWNKKRGELPEVSQEKSKLGLGELYEREFLKKAVGYDVDKAEKQTEEDKAKDEMKALFANLCSKLDALSNYHFAPRPVADEADVRAVTTPAIAMEEVMPLHVSDARGVAPEEVYGKKHGRDAVLRGETELDQTERKRLRSAKKTARRKKRKEKLADEKLISRLQPGLGLNNPYEKRKMREELQMARASGKVSTGERDDNADYGASGKFFRRMQEEVEQTVNTDSNNNSSKKKKFDSHGQKSSAFKL